MRALSLILAVFLTIPVFAEEGVRRVTVFNYQDCVELSNGSTRVVLGHHVGGRVLKYEHKGKEVLHLDPREKQWEPGKQARVASAGRFDVGPEYTVPRHELLWKGEWTVRVTGPRRARMSSQRDEATGVQLTRDFELAANSSYLKCTQTITNVSKKTVPWCHWSRTFAKGGGIVVLPLEKSLRRFPEGYVMIPERHLINLQPKDEKVRRRGDFLEVLGAPAHPKLGMDVDGWLAYLLPADVAFVKRYETSSTKAYGEVAAFNTSVWYPDQKRLPAVELEPIGPANQLAPGAAASFTEHWWILEQDFPKEGAQLDLEKLAARVKKECSVAK